jgi:hypothetical protein
MKHISNIQVSNSDKKSFVYILLVIALLAIVTATSKLFNTMSFISGMVFTCVIAYLVVAIESKF